MRSSRGQILPIVTVLMAFIIILVTALVKWSQQDTVWSVKQQKSADAVNLAEAGIDRAQWKLQSTTATWAAAAAGTVIPGYNFDTTYTDVPGGTYRIKLTTGPLNASLPTVVITAEGRDANNKETRALTTRVDDQVIYSVLMSGGNVNWAKGLGVYWGPIMAQGTIQLMDDYVAEYYFPLKYAKGDVIGTATYPRDTSYPLPPNTDNVEWWANYSGVPPVPVLDFVTLRAQAAASGTLNVYGCRSTQGGAGTNNSPTRWDIRSSCTSSGNHATHFGNPWSHPKSAQNSPAASYVWYWDGDLTLSGQYCGGSACGESTGLQGIFIVRGNLTIDTPGEYNYTGHVPANAWAQHNKLTKTTFDTAASREYPADTGLHSNSSTFRFGTDTWTQPIVGGTWKTTVGLKGFVYVGGNLTIDQFMDFNGAVWVNGSVSASGGTDSTFCGIFYDDTLSVPTLNVILQRLSWNETSTSSTPWP